MKKLILSFVMMTLALAIYAQSGSITLNFCDGTTSTLLLSEKPSLTFVGQTITIKTTSSTTTIERSMLKGFSSNGIDGIENPSMGNGNIKAEGENLFRIEGNVKVIIVDAEGKQVSKDCINVCKEGTEVNLNKLPKGIYVISINNSQTIKYCKK